MNTYRHVFADNQNCIKCGKGEWMPDADDCPISNAEYDQSIKANARKPWSYVNTSIDKNVHQDCN